MRIRTLMCVSALLCIICSSARGEIAVDKPELDVVGEQGFVAYDLEGAIYLDDTSAQQVEQPVVTKRYVRSRAGFNLPKSFYYVGAPIFLLLFLRVMALFLRLFEEERKEELKEARLKALDPE